jgi:hypothetical protein
VTHRLLLLRHGEVTSHRGDVAVTDRGLDGAKQVPGMTLDEAAAVPFFVEFFDHPDRIGWRPWPEPTKGGRCAQRARHPWIRRRPR